MLCRKIDPRHRRLHDARHDMIFICAMKPLFERFLFLSFRLAMLPMPRLITRNRCLAAEGLAEAM